MFAASLCAKAATISGALDQALRGSDASAVVVDARSGAVLASYGAARRAVPGSAIKPLLLEYALEHNVVRAETEVYCRRDLHVGGRALPCSHPANQPVFTAQSALAESCNTWFAEMGRRFSDASLEAALSQTRLPHTSLDGATVERRQLAALGLAGVTASPLELAKAYVGLLQQAPADGTVVRGLRDSVVFGMANPAAVVGMDIVGKTGTAIEPGQTWTHGWFAGAMPGRLIVVVFVPRGDGGDAARAARRFFVKMERAQ